MQSRNIRFFFNFFFKFLPLLVVLTIKTALFEFFLNRTWVKSQILCFGAGFEKLQTLFDQRQCEK